MYNVRVVIADDKLTINDTLGNAENTENRRETNLVSCYAFVDFYSAKAALKAIQGLTCRILTAGKPARVGLWLKNSNVLLCGLDVIYLFSTTMAIILICSALMFVSS